MLEFLSQNGFGGFIWSSFACGFVFMLVEVFSLRRQRKQHISRIKRLQHLSRK